jgi:hypothetical protein
MARARSFKGYATSYPWAKGYAGASAGNALMVADNMPSTA